MFRFFKITEVLAFADSVASEYDRLVRSTVLRDDSPQKRQQKFEKLSQKVDAYTREQKLNFYKKSKMLYAIKEGLKKNGVAESEITAFLNNLLAKGLRKI
jgi:cell division septum initiation protein DivIVA